MKKIIPLIIMASLVLSIFTANIYAQQQATHSTDSGQAEESDSIREKVKEKVEQARNQPKAYIGTITDITEETLQIKNKNDEIRLISFGSDKTFFVKVNKTSKNITFEEVGIGDFITAMGFIDNETQVLDAKRVLITAPLSKLTRSVIVGEVTEVEKRKVTMTGSGTEEITLEFPKRWKGPEIAEIEEGQTLIAVGELEEKTLTIRTIEIASSPEPSPTPETEE
jgi:hypothetical protein